MKHTDLLRALAIRCRVDRQAALFAVAWLAADQSSEDLQSLLEALDELQRLIGQPDHLTAYEERWGRRPATR